MEPIHYVKYSFDTFFFFSLKAFLTVYLFAEKQ